MWHFPILTVASNKWPACGGLWKSAGCDGWTAFDQQNTGFLCVLLSRSGWRPRLLVMMNLVLQAWAWCYLLVEVKHENKVDIYWTFKISYTSLNLCKYFLFLVLVLTHIACITNWMFFLSLGGSPSQTLDTQIRWWDNKTNPLSSLCLIAQLWAETNNSARLSLIWCLMGLKCLHTL